MPTMNEVADNKTNDYSDMVIAATKGKENSKKIFSYNQRPKTGLQSSLAPRKLMVSASKSAAKANPCKRHIDDYPSRIMDAPNVINDFYCNTIHWGEADLLAVGLGPDCFVWNSSSGEIR